MRRLLSVAVAAALLAPACFGGGEVTDSGEGLPQVEVEFPARARPGSVQEAVFTVTNPGPGAMQGVTIAFARVGNDHPIVDPARDAVVGVSPEPRGVEAREMVYVFASTTGDGGAPLLPEGESASFTFELLLPNRRGVVANSVTVSASEDLERIRGLRLETELR